MTVNKNQKTFYLLVTANGDDNNGQFEDVPDDS